MLRVVGFCCLVALATATPAIVRSMEEVQAFRHFLESTRDNNGVGFFGRSQAEINPEEGTKYQGDILLDELQVEDMLMQYAQGRNAYVWPEMRWPDNTVVWEFGEDEFDDEQKEAILDGIRDIEEHTCVRFRYRQPEETAFVRVTGGPGGCFAHVGYSEQRGVHTLNLLRNVPGEGCFRHATIVHEWMHILGFLHMQSTYNRDNYVKIVEENIRPGMGHNFDISSPDRISNQGVEYDYVSCLHYGPLAFSTNGEPTIVALQEHEGTMGQRVFITDKDWLRINRHHSCPGAFDEK